MPVIGSHPSRGNLTCSPHERVSKYLVLSRSYSEFATDPCWPDCRTALSEAFAISQTDFSNASYTLTSRDGFTGVRGRVSGSSSSFRIRSQQNEWASTKRMSWPGSTS
jgi:hypothetical protein